MAREEGIVLRRADRVAWVLTQRAGACQSCASREACGTGGKGAIEVEAINLVSATEGDRVELSCQSGPLLRVIFLLYLFPVLCMLAAAVMGHVLASWLGTDPSVSAASLAVAALAAALLVARAVTRRAVNREVYRPRVTRILSKAPLHLPS